MKKQTRILILFTVLFITIVSILLWRSRNEESLNQNIQQNSEGFYLIDESPNNGDSVKILFPNLALEFIFSLAVDPNNTTVNIEPWIDLEVDTNKDNPRILNIIPRGNWQFDTTYKINLNPTSIHGDRLDSPIEYEFTPQELNTIILDE